MAILCPRKEQERGPASTVLIGSLSIANFWMAQASELRLTLQGLTTPKSFLILPFLKHWTLFTIYLLSRGKEWTFCLRSQTSIKHCPLKKSIQHSFRIGNAAALSKILDSVELLCKCSSKQITIATQSHKIRLADIVEGKERRRREQFTPPPQYLQLRWKNCGWINYIQLCKTGK